MFQANMSFIEKVGKYCLAAATIEFWMVVEMLYWLLMAKKTSKRPTARSFEMVFVKEGGILTLRKLNM